MTPTHNAHALVIGVAAYQSVIPLPATVSRDAQDLADLLANPQRCGYRQENVTLLLDGEATRVAILEALRDLAIAAGGEATAVIYFSGHGARLENGGAGDAYLVPVEARVDALAETAISATDFAAALQAIEARRLLVIFDSCHAGGLGLPKDVDPLVATLKAGLPESYYAKLAVGQGRVIMASSRSTELSWVMPGDANSLFTKHVLAGLRGGTNGPDGLIRVFDLFDFVGPRVTEQQPEQHPIFKAELENNFPIALRAGGKATAIPAAPSDEFVYDVFINYGRSRADRQWVRQVLVPQLTAAGLHPCVDYECFQLAVPQILEMERAVTQSRYTLAVLSPDYLDNHFAELENVMAEHLGRELGQYRLVGIMRENCRPRLGMRTRLVLDMSDETEFDFNLQRLISQLNQPLAGG